MSFVDEYRRLTKGRRARSVSNALPIVRANSVEARKPTSVTIAIISTKPVPAAAKPSRSSIAWKIFTQTQIVTPIGTTTTRPRRK
jgi:hypothetical protein